MSINQLSVVALMRLLQLSDSALPVGTFSFSNTLESAVEWGIVYDDATLEQYCTEITRMTAFTDGVAALKAHRACQTAEYEEIVGIDNILMRSKLNNEARMMTQRMGRKLAELGTTLLKGEILHTWCNDIKEGKVAGTYPVTQALIASLCGISRQEFFCSICYGAANIILNAALRCMRTTHIATQHILWHIAEQIDMLYNEASDADIEAMNNFTPQCDIMAALHEKGARRLFMN